YLLIMDISLIIFIMVLVANLITDIIYAYLDPRIKY
ncbi:ABC transporter permease, partial [Candidatus Bathyarchaeota archaeon]